MSTRYFLLFLFIFGLFSVSFWLEGQDKNSKKKENLQQKQYLDLRQKIFQDLQLFERTFQNDSDFLQLHQEMERLMRQQLKGALSDEEVEQLLNPRSFGNAFDEDHFSYIPHSDGFFEWGENDKERILTIKIKMPADKALDIKIAKNQIQVSGEIVNGKSRSQFTRVTSVPSDCDGTKAQIQTDEQGFAQVLLPKLDPSATFKNKSTIPEKEKIKDQREPVKPSGQGVSI